MVIGAKLSFARTATLARKVIFETDFIVIYHRITMKLGEVIRISASNRVSSKECVEIYGNPTMSALHSQLIDSMLELRLSSFEAFRSFR